MPSRPVARRSDVVWLLTALLAAAVVVAVAGATTKVPGPRLRDDLGPTSGQRVSEYLDMARQSLSGPSAPRWALVSFSAERDAAAVTALLGPIPLHRAIFHVPIPGQQTPVITVGVAGGSAAFETAFRRAARAVDVSGTGPDVPVQRTVAARLQGGCACVVGVVVRAGVADLRTLASRPGVRAVEAAPSDSTAVSATPLLPQYTDTVGPVAFGKPDP